MTPTTTQPSITTPQATPQATQPQTTQFQLIQQLPAIGPCSRVEIISSNINLAGVLILNQYGNNIFNNNYVKSNLSDITGLINAIPLSISNINALFGQTNNIFIPNNSFCDFNSNITDTNNPNNYILNCTNINNSDIKTQYSINPSLMFSSPNASTISINIPQTANNNPLPPNITLSNISRIILCLNSKINNSVMLNNLDIRAYDLNNTIISKWNVSEKYIDPATNFLTLVLPSSYPVTTKSNVSNFANIKNNRSNFTNIKNRLKFADVVAKPEDVVLAQIILVPTTTQPMTTQPMTTFPMTTQPMTTFPMTTQPMTTQPMTTQPMSTFPMTTQPMSTFPMTTQPMTTFPMTTQPMTTFPMTTFPMTTQPMSTFPMTTQPMTTFPMTTQSLSNNRLQNKSTSSPSKKIYQRNFDGSSNVYTPSIYYNMEKFVPLNSLDEYYAPY
jgi:hypothetical protein